MVTCHIIDNDTLVFYQFVITALLAIESLLLAVFGSIFGVYAVYKTLEVDGKPAFITNSLIRICQYLAGITCLTALFASYLLYQTTCQSFSKIPISISIPFFLLIIAIVFPTIFLVMKMR